MTRPAFRFLAAVAVAALAAASLSGHASASAGKDPFRLAFVGPLSGPLALSADESLLGIRWAAEHRNGKGGVEGRTVEVVPLDEGDDPKKAAEQVRAAQKGKFDAILAAATGVTVEAVATQARRGRTPVLLVGTAPPPRPSTDPSDPVLYGGSWPVDQAINLAGYLSLHSDRAHLGLHGDCLEPALVVEDTPRGRELADALARNLGERQHLAGRIVVPPHGAPAPKDLEALRAARCDRLVLVGEPDLVDGTAASLAAIGWEVPLFGIDGMISRAATALHDGRVKRANLMFGLPQRAYEDHLPPTYLNRRHREVHAAAYEAAAKEAEEEARPLPEKERKEQWARILREAEGRVAPPLYPRTILGWFAASTVFEAVEVAREIRFRTLLEGLREVRYGKLEKWMAVFDPTGRTALYRWYLWTAGERWPVPIWHLYLPTGDFGPPLRMRTARDWDAVPIREDTRIVWLTYGEKEPKIKSDHPRTIEADLKSLGMSPRGYEGYEEWILDELSCRILGKINRLFLKNYDGTFIPGLSYNVHFTFTKPEHLKPHEYWTGIIAGDDPAAGGRVIGSGRVAIFSSYMIRTSENLRSGILKPPLGAEDKRFINGLYPWGTSEDENKRADSIRCLLDGYASFMALTGAHEFGHVCGCGHDTESVRSIMNVTDEAAIGLRETNAEWIPSHAKAVENTLGIYEEPKRTR